MTQLDQSTVAQQVALFNQVFCSSRSEADWLYKHRDNPLSTQYNIFGAVNGGEIIGINGFMPMNFQIEDQALKAVQSCDSAVNPNYRGQGVFAKIITSAEVFYRDLHVDFLLGFPNKNSYPVLMKIGWLHLLDMQSIMIPCNIIPMLEMKLKISLPKEINKLTEIFWRKTYSIANQYNNIKVLVSDISPFSEHEYKQINRSEKLVFSKSPQVVKWKLDNNPLHTFKYYIASKENRLLSFLIVQERVSSKKNGMRWFRIIDWGLLSDNMNNLACSYAKMLLIMKNTADLISLWMPTERRHQDMFKRLGFIKNNKYFPVNQVLIKVLTNDVNRINLLKNKNNWQPKLIEVDTLL
ncbi:MAG: GNAT family N-acetyltransferase [Deltaproteobacteria bacterium]|nr:GNAT family N-acetyltransferase [Deltaproteobacteria bacterium]